MKWIVTSVVFALLTAVVLPALMYFYSGGFNGHFSTDDQSWANFGSYLGGVAGPLLSFASIVLLLLNLKLQSEQVEALRQETLASQHIRMLTAWLAEIDDALDVPVKNGDGTQKPFRSYLGEDRTLPHEVTKVSAQAEDLVNLIFGYAEAVALYRDNITPYFDCKYYEHRGRRMIDLIGNNLNLISIPAKIRLEYADMHIRNENSRNRAKFGAPADFHKGPITRDT